ncbi:DNA repair protein RAD50 [Anopheles cruzii]|uniref:DNA repair protein RAD50 n=1 Tax=Anopheles cruzii TaxID=68878 RepID=UPI0022EC6321|nr:DNA repair protein RAD50 [Anopheles cruzii]
MSTVSKLEIRGIRSYGVDSADVQKINFRTPLTLIVGQNGCGKTTIIECLKYGLTGEVPQGTNRGIGFVHDPKIFHSVESLGQVKLMVKDHMQNTVTAIRSMKISLKGKNPKFETLDSTIVLENAETKAKSSLTRSRTADINNEMCEAMGVSRAILNNVIFCHQEDSCWPLEEPKELKKRFDAIFGTTEYNRLLDKLVKSSKEYCDRQKEKQGDLKLLQELKTQAEQKRVQLEDTDRKHTNLQQRIIELQSDIDPILKKLDELALIEREYNMLIAKKIDFSSKIQSKQEEQSKLKSKITQLFEGTLIELEQEIRIFQQKTASKKSELEATKGELETTKSKDRVIQGKWLQMDQQRIAIITKQQRERELKIERSKKIVLLGEKLKLSLPADCHSATVDLSVIQSTIKAIQQAVQAETRKVQSMATEYDEEDVLKQREIDKLREAKATLESDCLSKRKQTQQMERDKLQAEGEVSKIELSAQTLSQLNNELVKLEHEYEAHVKSVNLPAMKEELAKKKRMRDQLQDQLEQLEERISAMDEFAIKGRELTLKEQQCNARDSEFRRMRNKHADSLRGLFPDRTIESNYKRNVQDLYDALQQEIKTIHEKANRSQMVVTEMETLRKTQKLQHERLVRELAEAEEKIYSACRGNPYDEVVAKLKEKIDKNTLEHGEERSAMVLFQKFISNIKSDKCCPVCDKELNTDDVQDVSGKLSDKIRRLPQKIESLERTLKNERLEYDKLLALKSVVEELEKQKLELAKLKQQLQDTERRLTKAADELEEYQLATSEPAANLQLISTIVGDMSVLDEMSREVDKLQRGVEQLRGELGSKVADGASIDSLKIDRESLRGRLKTERRLTDELQSEFDTMSEKLNNLQSRNNEMKSKKLKLQESVQSLEQKRAIVRELAGKIGMHEAELKQAQPQLATLKQELDQKVEEKSRTKHQNALSLQKARKSLEALNFDETEIGRLGSELGELEALNLNREVERLQDKMKQLKDERDSIVLSIEKQMDTIETIKQDITDQHVRERNLIDNRDLKRLIRESADLVAELDALKKNMGEMELSSVQKERTRLIDLRDGLQAKRSEVNGQVRELQLQIKGLREVLEQSKFKNAIRNFRKTFCEAAVLGKMVSDIKKHRDAVERALREYHTEKMVEINRNIFSLWRDIYRGNDIDYIRIKTEDDPNAPERSDKRRLYSYGVVQAKNDVEIEMRGRCSAGQRVLASLIIRLALSETFSANCGVMALDEPTTNLDRDNIESLCDSLRRIVAERAHSNFLLVVITHDEEFVTKLEKFETYYRISRNNDGKSIITEEQL